MIKSSAFSIVIALFVMVVLSMLLLFAVSISNMNRNVVSFSIQGVKAYFAARSGLEWGIYKITQNPISCHNDATFTINEGNLKGFTVVVTCALNTVVEGVANVQMFSINSIASKGTFGDLDYVSREVQISLAIEQ